VAGGTRLILASGSPQRRAILEQLGVPFEVIVTGADELSEGRPEAVAVENACRKARAAVAESNAAAPVLGVDTLVALDYGIYGKPTDRDEAVATLTALAGRTHRVVSGVCLIEADGERTAAAVTQVSFRPMSESAIEWYVDTGEWQGRAGGYAIQGRGAALVESIQGDYLNVVGLPVATLLDLLPSLLF
jgi:septum formation protein